MWAMPAYSLHVTNLNLIVCENNEIQICCQFSFENEVDKQTFLVF